MMNLFILLVIFGVVSSSFADYDVQLEASWEAAEILGTASGISLNEKDKGPNSLFSLSPDQDTFVFKTQTLLKYPDFAQQAGEAKGSIAQAMINGNRKILPAIVSKKCYCSFYDYGDSTGCTYSPTLTSICDRTLKCSSRKIFETVTHGTVLAEQQSVVKSIKVASYTALYSTAQLRGKIGGGTESMLYHRQGKRMTNWTYCTCILLDPSIIKEILCTFSADQNGACSESCPRTLRPPADRTVLSKLNSLIVPTRAESYTLVSLTQFP